MKGIMLTDYPKATPRTHVSAANNGGQMNSCITVKGKQYEHQVIYSGASVYDPAGEQVHCTFCQQAFASKEDFEKVCEEGLMWRKTRFPEGAEL